MTVLTPSYRPDHALCSDLNASVTELAPTGTVHSIIVPAADRRLFAPLRSARTHVIDVDEVMPKQLRKVPGLNMWLNLHAPLPPVRGWVAQQIVKLAAVAAGESDVVVVADSDLLFIRPFSVATFAPDGRVPLYRLPGAVTPALPRHMLWHEAARRLLGLPASSDPVRTDYICWPCAWEPPVVRRMLARVEQSTGVHWATAVGRELHFSEMILYGVFVEEIEAERREVTYTEDMLCPSHPDEIALDRDALTQFCGRVRTRDVAVMVSAKSGTDLAVRRDVLGALAARTTDRG